jgi:hypothetical protein
VVAHTADGGGWKTTIILTNAGNAPAQYALSFYNENGSSLLAGFELDAGALSGTIPQSQSVTIPTTGADLTSTRVGLS